MGKVIDLSPDDYAPVTPKGKVVDLSPGDYEIAAPEEPAAPGPWRGRMVPHTAGAPAPNNDDSLGPTPAAAPWAQPGDTRPEDPYQAIADAKAAAEEAGGVGGLARRVGAGVSRLADTVAGAPGEFIDHPARAATSFVHGMADAMTLGKFSPERQLADLRAGKLKKWDSAHPIDTATGWGSPGDMSTGIVDGKVMNTRDMTPEQFEKALEYAAQQDSETPGANVVGAIVAPSPGKLAAGKIAAALPAVASTAGRVAKAATVAGAASGLEGAGRAVVAGASPLEALEAGAETGATGYVAGAALTLPIEAGSAALRKLGAGAPGRIGNRTFQELGTGATPPEQQALMDARPEVERALAEHKMQVGDASKLRTESGAARAAVTAAKNAALDAAERPTNADELIERLSQRRDQLAANHGTSAEAKKLDAFIDHVKERWGIERPPQAPLEPAEPPKLTDREVLAELAHGAGKAARAEASVRAEDVTEAIKKFDIRAGGGDPRAIKAATDAALDTTGKAIGKLDKLVTDTHGGMPITEVMKALDGVAKKYASNPAQKGVAASVDKLIEDVRDTWKDQYPVEAQTTRIPLQQVRRLSSQLGENAFTGDPTMAPKVAARVRRDIYGAIRDAMKEHYDEALAAHPELKAQVGDVAALNRDYGALRTLKKIVDPQAVAAELPRPAPPTTVAAIPTPPPLPKSGQIPLHALRAEAAALTEGSPERALIESTIAQRVSEAEPSLAERIKGLSEREQALAIIEDAAKRRAPKQAFQGTSRFSQLMGMVGDKGTTLTGLGTMAAKAAIGPAAEAADRALAKLIVSAHGNRVTPAIISTAIQAGASRADVLNVLDQFGIKNVPLPEEPAEGDQVASY